MIYFVTARSVGLVKIGFATKVQERFTSMKTHSPIALALERVTEGSRRDEAGLHVRFTAARSHGEWFRITDEIDVFMRTLPVHQWRHRGWHHAARRAEKAAVALRDRTPEPTTARAGV